jgi:Predicted AAA-ATPase
MERLPDLPIGLQYFADIRKSNSIYIDKTEYIYELCRPPNRPYFLSRPRRFGKSLTLDTIAELFSGNRALFEGLWIEDKWDWSETHPVIRLSFDSIGHESGLEDALTSALNDIARRFNVELQKKKSGSLFKELIEKVTQKTGKQVVILIDEYDKPIISTESREQEVKNREILRHFFSIIKNASNLVRFLLITCISSFVEVGIFAELNHLNNITNNQKFADLCCFVDWDKEL